MKAYPPRVGGGLGAFLCGLAPGESANMKVINMKELESSNF